jgi:hypothetical protein
MARIGCLRINYGNRNAKGRRVRSVDTGANADHQSPQLGKRTSLIGSARPNAGWWLRKESGDGPMGDAQLER